MLCYTVNPVNTVTRCFILWRPSALDSVYRVISWHSTYLTSTLHTVYSGPCRDLGKTTTWLVIKRRFDNMRVLYYINATANNSIDLCCSYNTHLYRFVDASAITYSKQHSLGHSLARSRIHAFLGVSCADERAWSSWGCEERRWPTFRVECDEQTRSCGWSLDDASRHSTAQERLGRAHQKTSHATVLLHSTYAAYTLATKKLRTYVGH